MTKFTDLDPSQKWSVAINFQALDLAVQTLALYSQGKIKSSPSFDQVAWLKSLHSECLKRLGSEENVEDFCEFLDEEIANAEGQGIKIVQRSPSQKHKSDLN